MCKFIFLSLVFFGFLSIAHADPLLGKLKILGVDERNCITCYVMGLNVPTISNPMMAWRGGYDYQKIYSFKSGGRNGYVMTVAVSLLSGEKIRNVAAWFNALGRKTSLEGRYVVSAGLGEDIYKHGIVRKEVPACLNCHVPNGVGSLAGKRAELIVAKLIKFQSSKRNDEVVRSISDKLSDRDIYKHAIHRKDKPACLQCHFPNGGEHLTGVRAEGAIDQIIKFQFSRRHDEVMRFVSGRLSKKEMKMVAKYIQNIKIE